MAPATPSAGGTSTNAYLINAAVDVHHDDPAFGYRFIADELERLGHRASENRVQRLCSAQRTLVGAFARSGAWPATGPSGPRRPGRAGLHAPTTPNELWLTDITEHRTGEGKLYSAPSRTSAPTGSSATRSDARMTAALAVRALHQRPRTRGRRRDTIVHSDRGSQFRSHAYVRALADVELRGSMGRVGNVRRQRRHGVVLLTAPEERARLQAMEDARGTPSGHRHLDRADLQPPPPSAGTREAHAESNMRPSTASQERPETPDQPSQPKAGQSRTRSWCSSIW